MKYLLAIILLAGVARAEGRECYSACLTCNAICPIPAPLLPKPTTKNKRVWYVQFNPPALFSLLESELKALGLEESGLGAIRWDYETAIYIFLRQVKRADTEPKDRGKACPNRLWLRQSCQAKGCDGQGFRKDPHGSCDYWDCVDCLKEDKQ